MKFINYIYRLDVYVKILDFIEIFSINIEVDKFIIKKFLYDVEKIKNV